MSDSTTAPKLRGLNLHVTPDQHDALSAISRDTGASMAHLVRLAVAEYLQRRDRAHNHDRQGETDA